MDRIRNFFRSVGSLFVRFFGAIGRFVKRHKVVSILGLVLLAGGTTALVLFLRMNSAGSAPGVEMAETTMLAPMDLELVVTATGTLQSADVHEVTSTLSYDISEVFVAEGDQVEEGQVLAQLDTAELDKDIQNLREEISETQASDALALAQAERKLQDAINQRDIDDARLAAEIATAQDNLNTKNNERDNAYNTWQATDPADATAYGEAENTYNTKSQEASQAQETYNSAVQSRTSTWRSNSINIENAQDSVNTQRQKNSTRSLEEQLETYLEQQEETTITAPAAGTITAMTAEVGESAGGSGSAGGTTAGATAASGTTTGGTTDTTSSSSSALFTIESMGSLEVPLSIAEYDAVDLTVGLSAKLTTDALEDETFAATVSSISPTASSGYFTVTVKVTADIGELTPGMSATVDVITDSRQGVYAVPYDAVTTNKSGQTVVYALDAPQPGAEAENRSMAAASDADGEEGTPTPAGTEIVVETGLETDYYIEIISDELHDGMLISNDPLGNNVQAQQAEGTESGGLEIMGGFGGGGGTGGGAPPEGGGGMPDGGGMPGGAP